MQRRCSTAGPGICPPTACTWSPPLPTVGAACFGTGSPVSSSSTPNRYDITAATCNHSLGLVQCELLRQMSLHLGRFPTALARSRWVRGYLAEQKLAGQGAERFLPGAARIEECRTRGERMVRRLTDAGYDVVGDLEEL